MLLICPCKGAEQTLPLTVQSLLMQDYPASHVVFVVESMQDPAYALLRRMHVPQILVAGLSHAQGQKVHNLAAALADQIMVPYDVYAFCDSDAIYPPSWLRALIAPLTPATITTSYRWYAPYPPTLPVVLRHAWNASTLLLMRSHPFIWGGSWAITRRLFHTLRLLDAWQGACSEDSAVTTVAKKAGRQIVYVPEALAYSSGVCTLRELFTFVTRQLLFTRVYHPPLFWCTCLAQGAALVAFLLLWRLRMPVVPLTAFALLFASTWRLSGARAALCLPGTLLLNAACSLAALCSRVMTWRGITYRLVSAHTTEILRRRA